MTIPDFVNTILTSGTVATLVGFVFQKYFDRRLEELKASLQLQTEIRNLIASQRLEIYPSIVTSVYRLRNSLREMTELTPLTVEGAVAFLRLADQYTEQVFSSRLYLNLDRQFEALHEYKNHVLKAKHLLLDWLDLTKDLPSKNTAEINRVLAQLREVYVCMDEQHGLLIESLTKLTTA